jgi:disease resistance protein RPM1
MGFLYRYLIVIDDLWETSAWDNLSSVLPENNMDSIIITTTRNESVANTCRSSYHLGNFVYSVASMNDSDSKALFFGRIFGSEDNCPHDLKEVSMKILKKCGGLPLAIVCISSLLAATQPQATRWEKVYSSLGSEIEGSGSLYRLKQALQLGFDDLPQHLKVCVLYLSSFPENSKIQRDRLTRRWIAEGFVAEKPGMSVQEVAKSYFSELIGRTMIQAVDVDCHGEAHACRIHDVMFELIAMKSFEENFVTLVGDRWGSSTQRRNVRRLSLNCRTAADGFDLSGLDMSHARSLTIYGDIGSINSISEFRFLRMLDFECCEGVDNRHLKNIGDLFLLKYLSLKSTWISELPMQIGDLKCLETLDLTQTNITELPKEVTRLQKLVDLLAGVAELPQGVGNMTSLQTLCIRAASKRSREAMEELLRLINLRKLDLSYVHPNYERLDTRLPLVISKLGNCKLQSLHLSLLGDSMGLFLELQSSLSAPPDTLQSLKIKGGYGFLRVPKWISSLTHLAVLELTVAAMDERDLEILTELPRLIRFRLTVKEPSAQGITIQESCFPNLKELYINCRIMPVFFSRDAMLKLQKFELQFHAHPEDLEFVQFSTEHFQSLKEFRFMVVCKGLSDPGIEFLKEAFKNAVFI